MIEKQELNQLTSLAQHGPIPASVVKNVIHNCIQVGITNEDYVKASEMIMNNEIKMKDLKEYKEWAEAQLDADRQAFANIQNKSERREVIYDGKKRGWLLGWGGGSGYPVGIVESEFNPVHTPSALNIKFVNWTKEEEKDA